MPDGDGTDVASEDIDAAQAVLVALQAATAQATEELNERHKTAKAEERGLVDIDYSTQSEIGSTDAKKVVRVAMFFGYNGSGYHVRSTPWPPAACCVVTAYTAAQYVQLHSIQLK